ncbi:glutathione peroxidase [Nostoc linckia z18]|jgi:glutathione peroxidase|uniref:Glutathione peroxidase n=3 Tax=Nostoc TaxID=1177 RepID=A0A9Q5Z7F5_NOSLI|nr:MULTISPECIES: glutathione peroxidase [Nostoc]MBL1203539.1 glutathione peroxidase [Nostoc sp. GBBB01]MDZ8014101.1 glutathione peroxidase [Nostoc sp. ZfuVER08]PHK27855.1 glutathione peroxidase [Nostoc linckia z15]PHK43196.1 glutathione peroxidase [Nostoc linckia z16]MBC1241732.1 glutathione peroxidase [Nostoc sp. 2RC]
MSNTISDIVVKTINDQDKQLKDYAGKVLLIVNVASYCGYTSQYSGLEDLNKKYKEAGLRVLGFPCNDFGAQEPGSNEQIVKFCTSQYGVTFELFDKIHAKGSQQHPLYERLTKAVQPTGDVAWNFEKFLVNKQGEVVARFKSNIHPSSPELINAIESELAK